MNLMGEHCFPLSAQIASIEENNASHFRSFWIIKLGKWERCIFSDKVRLFGTGIQEGKREEQFFNSHFFSSAPLPIFQIATSHKKGEADNTLSHYSFQPLWKDKQTIHEPQKAEGPGRTPERWTWDATHAAKLQTLVLSRQTFRRMGFSTSCSRWPIDAFMFQK